MTEEEGVRALSGFNHGYIGEAARRRLAKLEAAKGQAPSTAVVGEGRIEIISFFENRTEQRESYFNSDYIWLEKKSNLKQIQKWEAI